MIFDTDVIIWAQRGSVKAAHLIDAHPRAISIVSHMEFVKCARDKKEFMQSKNFLNALEFQLLPLTPDIGQRAVTYIEQFSLSHGMEIGDALIAATAFEHGLPLATANDRDYKMIKGLELVTFRPE